MKASVPFLLLATLLVAGCSSPDDVQGTALLATDSAAVETVAAPPVPAPPDLAAPGYVLMDAGSGQILVEKNADERLEPASLTKIMTAYAVFRALREGQIAIDDLVTISAHARAQEGSRMFVEVGSQVSVENLIRGMIVQSGNDATVALAEHTAGSEPVFVDLMNRYALQLGMSNTHFENSPGMPGPTHYTTARDMAILARALVREFPDYYGWYAEREFTWNGITQHNRNGLLARDPSVDGIKTGHTASAGYCLVSSAEREGMRLISVVMGTKSVSAREQASEALLNYGFRFYETRELYAAAQPLTTVRVWKGATDAVDLGTDQPVVVTVQRGQIDAIVAKLDVPSPLVAPLDRSEPIGTLRLALGDTELMTRDVYPLQTVEEAGLIGRLVDGVKMRFN
ncbi:MAG TPA: D-alanyl-D-alanine carboxypeptidase family protein [Steroidobacteraceae bacterium]|nr:D-alanyl-D-alanine carboxypeptidase family protein [Steroidobacteraceae bacterium]